MIIEWIINYALVMFAMSLDNIFWIPASPEWRYLKKEFKVIVLFGHEFGFPKTKKALSYCWHKRVLEVLKHPRDILPAIVTSLVMTLIWFR